ncbi:MAG: hypothetical protein HN742_09815 [Lentisphaerae bacterium]|jgi:hypothetical protein|nr:hypothetical protein [Lentisphaerota bacterium]MBT4823146.1 hypothetical protein [Lentisphaerota bacterium]MBT5610466.1 hypothetical protein [Lentisphaerota bacterium]MBT7061057.1 hypothetical protein [Lentisphaerota bacterium]MBT7842158.1 hypothetical protein [Lentisphaerota bacterium]
MEPRARCSVWVWRWLVVSLWLVPLACLALRPPERIIRGVNCHPEGTLDNAERDAFFAKLAALKCNAFQFSQRAAWDVTMLDPSLQQQQTEREKLTRDFVQAAHKKGLKAWLTVGEAMPPLRDANDPEFPFYGCVNNRWGKAYTKAVARFAQTTGVDAIGVAPDEWVYTNGRVRHHYERRTDPELATFYKELSDYCDCDVCRREFVDNYGVPYPEVTDLWSSDHPMWGFFVQFRIESTSRWMQRTIEAVKSVAPTTLTKTVVSGLPICSDGRLQTGTAWDDIGRKTDLDCLQTAPSLLLHNDLGDSTHYCASETALHLAAANWDGWAGIRLEACRPRDTYRSKDPAEVYGTALSCLMHGAREFFWWNLSYLQGKHAFVDPTPPSQRVAAAHSVMKAMEPYVLDAAPPGDVAVLYSRRSEDAWDWLGRKGNLPKNVLEGANPKQGFIAHRDVLYYLMRRGIPFGMTFLENPDPAVLEAARVLIAPFPFSLSKDEARLFFDLVDEGKTILLMSQMGAVDEFGQYLEERRLRDLFRRGRSRRGYRSSGRVVWVNNDAAADLFAEQQPVKTPTERVPLPPFGEEGGELLGRYLQSYLRRAPSLFATQPQQDIEVVAADGSKGRVLLVINWDVEHTATVRLAPRNIGRFTAAKGYAIMADATVKSLNLPPADVFTMRLAPQEARLLHLQK